MAQQQFQGQGNKSCLQVPEHSDKLAMWRYEIQDYLPTGLLIPDKLDDPNAVHTLILFQVTVKKLLNKVKRSIWKVPSKDKTFNETFLSAYAIVSHLQ